TRTTSAGWATVFPSGTVAPNASNLNWVAGQTVANLVTVPVGGDGAVAIFNAGGSVDLIADVVGWFDDGSTGSGSLYNPVNPARVLDSRVAGGPYAFPWSAGEARTVQVAGVANSGVPASGVTAVVVNLTVTDTTAAGYATVYPTTSPLPNASNLNWGPRETRPNLVSVPVGPDGRIAIWNAVGSADFIVDVVGYYAAGGAGFHPAQPTRILDSRVGTGGYDTPWPGGASRPLQATGTYGSGVPTSGVVAVILNVTVTDTTAVGYLTVHPAGPDVPTASNLNWMPGITVPNQVISKLSATGVADVVNSSGSTDVIADVSGWFG
ncbi:MAG TPA: hypothetical protein VF320_02370, partial [Acidimicrobiales bacterium]